MTERDKLAELLAGYYGVDPAYYGVDAYGIADHFLANGVTFQKWIPVTERLPGESEAIILVTDSEYPHRLPRVVRRKALTEKEFWGVSIGFFAHDVRFTHWMPLPELPKED